MMNFQQNQIIAIRSCYNFLITAWQTQRMYIYVYTDVQVQCQNLNTNKQIEAITNNELHCMSSVTYLILPWNTYREVHRQHIE